MKKASTVTRANLKTTAAMCRRTLGGEYHWYAIASPVKRGTDSMTVDVIHGHRRKKREEGWEPMNRTRFGLGVENEHDEAGRDGRTRLARPNS